MPCASSSTRRARPLLGTFVEIFVDAPPYGALQALIDDAFEDIAKVHALMSFHEPESDVGRLNREAGHRPVTVHAWTFAVLEAALDLYRRSAGTFDITVAPVLQRLGRLPASPRGAVAPTSEGGRRSIILLDGHRVRFSGPGVAIDLGGIAKGYAVDRALDVLRQGGLAAAHVNAGGDQAAFGGEGSIVHIRDPREPGRLLSHVALRDGALASSGGIFDPVVSDRLAATAVIDPARGEPATAIAGASVLAPTCMIADALTKPVMLLGEKSGQLLAHYRASALLVAADGGVSSTPDWPGAGFHAV